MKKEVIERMRIGHTLWLDHSYKKIKLTAKAGKGWKRERNRIDSIMELVGVA